jgi:hypothetical protein
MRQNRGTSKVKAHWMGGTRTLLARDGGGGVEGAPKAKVGEMYEQCTLCKRGIFKEMESPTDLNLERGRGGGVHST